MPRINLLPWREAERKRKRQEFVVGIVGALVVAALLGVAANLQLEAAISSQNDRNQLIEDQIKEVDKQITEILDLEKRKAALQARIEVIEQLQRSRPVVVHLFDQIVRTLPEGVYYTAVRQAGNEIKFEGIAQSPTRVSALMRNIETSEYLNSPALAKVSISPKGSEFTLSANQTVQKPAQPAARPNAQAGKRAGVAK